LTRTPTVNWSNSASGRGATGMNAVTFIQSQTFAGTIWRFGSKMGDGSRAWPCSGWALRWLRRDSLLDQLDSIGESLVEPPSSWPVLCFGRGLGAVFLPLGLSLRLDAQASSGSSWHACHREESLALSNGLRDPAPPCYPVMFIHPAGWRLQPPILNCWSKGSIGIPTPA
jgi:hypothetical protein